MSVGLIGRVVEVEVQRQQPDGVVSRRKGICWVPLEYLKKRAGDKDGVPRCCGELTR
jgi:hypothetical protein